MRALAVAALGWALTAAPSAVAHFGLGLNPEYSAPRGLVVTDGASPVVIAWDALEMHPEVDYTLSYQSTGLPPTPGAAVHLREGTAFATLAADGLSYEVPWDLDEVPSGAWHVYAAFEEPPFCEDVAQAPALIVVRRDGDPAPLGAWVSEPSGASVTVEDEARIGAEAIGDGPLFGTIEVGEIIQDPDFPDDELCVDFIWVSRRVVAEDVPLASDSEAGDDRWRLDHRWDTTDVPAGAYLARVTVRDEDGGSFVAYARRWINVERSAVVEVDPGPDAAIGPAADADASDASGADAGPAASDDGCRGASGAVGWGWLFALWALGRGGRAFTRRLGLGRVDAR